MSPPEYASATISPFRGREVQGSIEMWGDIFHLHSGMRIACLLGINSGKQLVLFHFILIKYHHRRRHLFENIHYCHVQLGSDVQVNRHKSVNDKYFPF